MNAFGRRWPPSRLRLSTAAKWLPVLDFGDYVVNQAVGGGFSMLTTRHAAFRSIVPLRQSLSVRAAGRNSDSGR